MATKKIELGGISFEDVEVDGKEIVLVSGKGNMTMTAAKKNNMMLTIGTGKNRASYIFANHAVYNSGRTAVSLIGAADDFKATASSQNKNLATINASQVSDAIEIIGNAKNNLIIAGDEDSTLNGGRGNDTLVGGAGEDIFVYKRNEGNDLIRDYNEDDGDQIRLEGGATVTDVARGKNYSVIFTVSKSKLTVENAYDQTVTFVDSAGKTSATFKDGVIYSADGLSVTIPPSFSENGEVTFDGTVATINASAAKKGVDLIGTAKDNSILGGAKNDTLSGENGNDTLNGGKGNDYLYGGNGNDSLIGGDGNDYLEGENGDDTLDGGKGNDKLYGGNGNDSLIGGDGNDTLEGEAGNDTLNGGKGNDKLYGGAGNDSLVGGNGNDILDGDAGSDTLEGGNGNDKLYGGYGDDILIGGKGNDTLWGDGGRDTFIYDYGDGKDVIYGFDNGDTLQINDFNSANLKGTVSRKGDSVTLKIGAGSVTFKDIDADIFHVAFDNETATYRINDVTNAKGKVTGHTFDRIS